jgi:hypothetical protein
MTINFKSKLLQIVAASVVFVGGVGSAEAENVSGNDHDYDSKSATDLTSQPTEIGQAPIIIPGRETSSGPSYIGVGANIGLGDDETAVGEGSFAVFSKIGLTQNFSIRPSVLVNDNPTILVPVTLDFIPLVSRTTERTSEELAGLRLSPYAGGGVAIATGDDEAVDLLVVGGVDIPLSDVITGTAQINATFADNTAVGIMLGAGYNF